MVLALKAGSKAVRRATLALARAMAVVGVVLVMVVVAGAAQVADVSYFFNHWSVIMKTSYFLSVALTGVLALSGAAYAAGPNHGAGAMKSAGAGSSASSGAQSRAGNPGVGVATRTQAQSLAQSEDQIRQRLQTHATDQVPGTGAGSGVAVPKGIHTPGTGLSATTTDVVAE